MCPDPDVDEQAFLEFLDQLAQRLGQPGVLFLTRDQDLAAVSRNQSWLKGDYHVPFASWDVVSQIVDKRGQYRVAEELGVPLPITHFPCDEGQVQAAVQAMPFPVILKPAYHARFSEHFGAKALVAHDPDQALEQYRRGAALGYDMMMQEIIPGGPERLYTYGSYLNPQGEPLAEFTGRKLRQHPRTFGTCRMGECRAAPQVVEQGLRLLRALGFWGVSQVEFKLDPRDDQFKLMEVNARNYQWQHLATVCGANLAHAAYRDAIGKTVTPTVASAYAKR